MSATTIAAPATPTKPWLTSDQVLQISVGLFLTLFFLYLFLPLIYMMLVTFNDSRIPTLTPWRGFTLRWFVSMWEDQRMWQSVWKSVVIGVAVIVLAVPLGLAGAVFMTRMRVPGQSLIYAVMISPILMPGIMIGLSTLIFWDRQFGIGGRWQLSVLGQTSFIAAYCMLIFMARLTRFDQTLEEAALDLGATPAQVFRTIMVPYMRPAILSAATLAFLQSLENFNTTLFTIGNDITLTMYIAGKIKSNVRELEGSLVRLVAIASLRGLPLSKVLAQQSMKNIIDAEHPAGMTMERIARAVASHYKMTVEEMKSKSNSRAVAVPRQVAMYLCKRLTRHSFPEIGREFGGKHHTTVMHSVDKITTLMTDDRVFHNAISELIDNLCN